ncbi:uncharacterized protein LOC116425956 [Nomia melanderi]|uniref:uncharacterized protein LOC116425956 n=1 Tax=Nomia melanderi TaxID=2448451 RepID=UPI001303FC87|nr:uncharacterized protein LOC116425956 [Nomia melanderi]
MKLALFALLATGCLIAVVRSEEEYDYEEEPAASPVTPSAPARPTSGRLGGLLSSRGRVSVGRKGAASTQATTAKPVEQPAEAEEEIDEELEENSEQQEEVPTTTTESSKIVRGGVRPFRSNQDLLAALKRRRAQVPSHRDTSASGAAGEPTTPKSNNKASTSSRAKSTATTETKSSGRGRFGGTRGKPIQEEVEETQREEVQVKPKPYRRG